MPQPRQVNVTQGNPQPLQWACPNANYLAQIIELEPEHAIFLAGSTSLCCQKNKFEPCQILCLILGPKLGLVIFLQSPKP